jgi:DNA-3-methyladenine glycosylase II
MAQQLILTVTGAFSLAAAASFGFGPNSGRPPGNAESSAAEPPDDGVLRLAFAADDLQRHIGAVLRQQPDGTLTADLSGDASPQAAEAQIRRILSVDADPAGWLAAGQTDQVLGRLQADYPGVRPVLFHSPYEAAAWSVLSQRRHRSQATALWQRLSAVRGAVFELAGQTEAAFPLPDQLLAVKEFPGIDEQRMARLHAVAAAALDGQLDAARLRAMDSDGAMPLLQRIKGLGPFYAMLVYLRSTGVTDGLALGEPRLAECLRHFYDLTATPGAEQIIEIARPWRPFRTWAGVLLRFAGDRAGLPFDQPAGRPNNRAQPAARAQGGRDRPAR